MSWRTRFEHLALSACLLACGGRAQRDALATSDAGAGASEDASSEAGTETGAGAAFVDVACGERSACALRSNGDAVCWGDAFGQSPPQGPFTAIAAGGGYACALSKEGAIECWGAGFPALPDGAYSAVSGELNGLVCGLQLDGSAVCRLTYPGAGSPVVTLPGSFTELAPGEDDACGLTESGSAVCVNTTGTPDPGWQDAPPGVALEHLACGANFCCGVESSAGKIVCWGDDTPNGERDAPDGTFTSISASEVWPCAERENGTIACWGKGWNAPSNNLPTGSFGKFCVGYAFGCGVRANGTLSCWGYDNAGVTEPPAP